ncbi:transmembrane protein 248 [Parambassis ranga]|uniref:Transmembrane protein 248 n=1 Tax=Parambassis ranga TaxID=210632 RepID=A0A6P7J1A4_9TELE|nr:transmembrane protein 248-like [Parambassis ranga]
MMGFWQPVTNLRDYVSQNPPGATFFLCLLTLAVTFICLSSYSHTHTLPNPDTVKDWNHILSSLSQFQLCVKANSSSSEVISSVPTPPPEQDDNGNTSVNSTKSASSMAYLHLKVPLTLTPGSPSASLKEFSLRTTLTASQLLLGGKETVNLTLEFLTGNSNHTCLSISAPAHLLPMSLLPPECPASEKNIPSILVEATNQLPTASQTCSTLYFRNDPTLTVMLTQEEQSVAVRHLLEVSVCLLGICLILCLTASLTQSLTRRYHWTGLDLQNEPLIDS